VIAALGLVATVAACGDASSTFTSTPAGPTTAVVSAPAPPTSTVPEGALELAAPPGAFPKRLLARFARASGCEVAVAPWSGDAATGEATLRAGRGTLDLVAAPAEQVRALALAGVVAPLATGAIDGRGTIASPLRSLPADTVDGRTVALPYAWEPLALLSRDAAFPDGPPTSLRTLWEPARTGTVALPDDPLTLAVAALSVGVDDPFAAAAPDLNAAVELVRVAGVRRRYAGEAALTALLRTGAATLALGPPRAALALGEHPAVTATVPREGAVGLVRTLALAARAPHRVCAYRFLAYVLEPQAQAAIAAVEQVTPAVPAGRSGDARARVCTRATSGRRRVQVASVSRDGRCRRRCRGAAGRAPGGDSSGPRPRSPRSPGAAAARPVRRSRAVSCRGDRRGAGRRCRARSLELRGSAARRALPRPAPRPCHACGEL
jgi:putative spermidine/putrescine transport system substrate-binding protein